MQDMQRALTITRVVFKQVSRYSVKCQKGNVRFEVTIAPIMDDKLHSVNFKRSAGDLTSYKEY